MRDKPQDDLPMKTGPRGARFFLMLAEWTGLEPATPGVTGRYSNQLNYHSMPLSIAVQTVDLAALASAANLASPRGFEPL